MYKHIHVVVQEYFTVKSIRDKKKPFFFQDIRHSRNSAKTDHFDLVLLNFCVFISSVNQM